MSFFWDDYFILVSFLGLYVMHALKNCFVYYARGENKFIIITGISVIEGVALLGIVLLLVCIFEQGIKGYIIGLFISNFIANLLYCLLLRINIASFLKIRNRELEKKMISYSVPMIFNSIGWWINNVSDRYMLTYFCSISLVGIYSVSYKIPGLLNTLVDVFMQAWKVSATEEYENGKIGHYNKGYRIFILSSILICSFLICFSNLFSNLLFDVEYQEAWKYSVILIIAFLFNGISGYLGTIFTAIKQTKYIAYSTIVGAVINVVLNSVLIPLYSATGAAIATVVSNIIIWIYRGVYVNKYMKIDINMFTLIFLTVILGLEAVFMCTSNFLLVILCLIFIVILCMKQLFVIKVRNT